MFAIRGLVPVLSQVVARQFHSTARAFVQVGDRIPDLDVLVEDSPGNKVNLSKELKGKGLIIGVPAAFSKFLSHPISSLDLHLAHAYSDNVLRLPHCSY